MTATITVRSEDRCRPYGIVRPDPPPDDELTDLAAWLAGRFDTLAADINRWGER